MMTQRLLFLLFTLAMVGPMAYALAQEPQSPADLCASAVPVGEPETRDYPEAPPRVIGSSIDYHAILCTEAGAIYVDLLEDYAPLTVNNFVFLAEAGYYNNTTFHRVIQDFMVQGGDPTGTGSGGPGYQFADEFLTYVTFEDAGLLAMANAGAGTNGSQFFITTVPTPHLNYGHTIFGYVVEGQENVLGIRLRDPETDTVPGTALQTVLIISDPAEVGITAPARPAAATSSADVEAAFAQIITDLPEGLIVDELDSGTRTNEQIVSAAPEGEREAYTEFLSAYNHEYRVGQALETTTCDLEALPFMAISAQVDAYPDAASAQAALDDGFLNALAVARGFSPAEDTPPTLTNTLYTQGGSVCDVPSTHALTYAKRGRYLVTYEVIVPQDSQFTPAQWLSEFVSRQVYDSLLSEIFVRELPWSPAA